MKTITEHIREHLFPQPGVRKLIKPLEQLRMSEWSGAFERYMRNRLVMGAIRYGELHAPNKPQYDRLASIIKRAEQYKRTKNKELLVDIANLCLCEFEEGDGVWAPEDGQSGHVETARPH